MMTICTVATHIGFLLALINEKENGNKTNRLQNISDAHLKLLIEIIINAHNFVGDDEDENFLKKFEGFINYLHKTKELPRNQLKQMLVLHKEELIGLISNILDSLLQEAKILLCDSVY